MPGPGDLLCLMIFFFFFQTVTNEKEELIGVWLHLLFLRQSGVYRISCSWAAILERLENTAGSKKNQRPSLKRDTEFPDPRVGAALMWQIPWRWKKEAGSV